MSELPAHMSRIAVAGGKGGSSALHPETVPVPRAGPGQVLIRVRAAGVNRPDILQRQGRYPPPKGAPDTLGLEVAGDVAAVGEGVERWATGARVCALLGGGGYAEYALADAGSVLPIPGEMDWASAAALPETVFTVFSNVFERARLQAGETLLVHGATSGIGATAIALAKAAGARVVATGRGAEKAEAARRLGADLAVDTRAEDFVELVKAFGGADVVLDMVGADYFQRNLEVMNPDGRMAVIAFQSGAKGDFDLTRMLVNRLTITASTLRARPAEEKARLAAAVEARVWPWVARGEVRPAIDKIFPLREAAAAHAYLEGGDHVGKVVLET